MLAGRTIAVDTETTGLNTWLGARPFLFTFADLNGLTTWREFSVDPETRRVDYRGDKELRRWLADPAVGKVFFNAKFDMRMCEAAGMPVRGHVDDVMFMAKVCRTDELSYGLKPLARKYGGFKTEDLDALKKAVQSLRTRAKGLGFRLAEDLEADYWLTQHAERIMVDSLRALKSWEKTKGQAREKRLEEARGRAAEIGDMCHTYGALDAERTMFLYQLYQGVMDDLGVRHIYDAEMRLLPVTYAMEGRGVHVDAEVAEAGRNMAARQSRVALRKLQRIAWPGFNPASYPDKVKLLVEREGLVPLRETDAGNPQVDKYFLDHYEDECSEARLIQDFSRADKAVGTYFNNYLSMAVDGLVHASFDQAGAKTLRYSCREPNFQNVPKRGKEGDIMLEVRRPLGPRPGCVWYMGDYSQIEARIFADHAGEETILEAFRAGRDVYDELTARVAELTGVEVTRRDTKDIFLGKLYGLGRKKMLRKLMASGVEGVTEEIADSVVSAFDTTFPRVREYQGEIMREVRREGVIINRYGQRVDADPDAAYKSVNHLIQSEAARLMKDAMVRCHRYLREVGYGWIVMTIHDELVFEFPADRRPVRVLRRLKKIMEDNRGMFCIPTPVEFTKTTGSWLDKTPCRWAEEKMA